MSKKRKREDPEKRLWVLEKRLRKISAEMEVLSRMDDPSIPHEGPRAEFADNDNLEVGAHVEVPTSDIMSGETNESLASSSVPRDIADDLVSLSNVSSKHVDGTSGHVDKENRKIESDVSEKTGVEKDSEPAGESLDEQALEILGIDPAVDQQKEVQINSAIISRWNYWIQMGLTTEEKEKLTTKYPRNGECNLEAPLLNPEVASSLTETSRKRDKYFVAAQNTLGSAMVALGLGFSQFLSAGEEGIDRGQLLQFVNDAGKLLAEVHYQQSLARRVFATAGIDKKAKTVLDESKVDKFLFGKDVGEKLKAAKAIEKVGKEFLKPPEPVRRPPLRPSNTGNWRGLPSRSQGRQQQTYRGYGPPRQLVKFKNYSRNNPRGQSHSQNYGKNKESQQKKA